MIVKNIIKSLGYSVLGVGGFAALSIILIISLFTGPDPNGTLTYLFEKLVEVAELEELGYTFADVAGDMFIMIAWLNVWLLVVTIIFALSWSVGSHFLNVDAPGKAKLYAVHWFILSGIFIGLVIITSIIVTNSPTFPAAQDITTAGSFTLTFYTTVYYTLAYYVSVLLGTARFVRSSVLLANKLPGNI